METCCGYGYGLARKSVKGFRGPSEGALTSANVTGQEIWCSGIVGGGPRGSASNPFTPVDVRELTTPSEATSMLFYDT